MDNIRVFKEVFESNENQDVEEFNQIIKNLNKCIENDQSNFIELCYWFKRLKAHFTGGYANPKLYFGAVQNKNGRWFFDTIVKNYGLDDSIVDKMIRVVEKFCVINTNKLDVECKIKPAFLGYTKSKLFELLPLSDTQIEVAMKNERITIKSTVKEIRDYVKSLKTSDKKENKVLEDVHKESLDKQEAEIQESYSPKKWYKIEYFRAKNKEELIDIIRALQREHFKNDAKFLEYIKTDPREYDYDE